MLSGYENFGARICRAFSAVSAINFVVESGKFDRAGVLATSLSAKATAACIDAAAPDLAQRLVGLDANLVIHTAEPFQDQDRRMPLAWQQAHGLVDELIARERVCI